MLKHEDTTKISIWDKYKQRIHERKIKPHQIVYTKRSQNDMII